MSSSDNKTRRDFLKTSGRIVGASALAGMAVPRVHAAENSTIKLAVVGCGGRGTGAVVNAFRVAKGPIMLHAMADLFEPRLTGSLKRLTDHSPQYVDVPKERQFIGFDAYKKAIDSLDPGDVVLLTTHAAFRPMHFEYAVNKGVNVFAEKSFAADAPAARRWLAAAELSEKKNLKVGVGFMWRHSKARQEVIGRIHDGAIGDVHTMRIYRVHGSVQCPRRPADSNELAFQLQHPNSFTWVSAGFFIDWHCHNVDIACWTKDAWPVSALGMGGRCYETAGNQMDHFSVEYTFADGTKLFAFSRHIDGCWGTYADYAHGSKGSAVIMANLSQPRSRIYKSQNMVKDQISWQFPGNDPNPYDTEWEVLFDAIRGDRPHNEARRAGEADVAALMGRAATHTGKEITWDQMMKSDFQFVEDIDGMTYDTEAPIHEGPDGLYMPPMPGITKEV